MGRNPVRLAGAGGEVNRRRLLGGGARSAAGPRRGRVRAIERAGADISEPVVDLVASDVSGRIFFPCRTVRAIGQAEISQRRRPARELGKSDGRLRLTVQRSCSLGVIWSALAVATNFGHDASARCSYSLARKGRAMVTGGRDGSTPSKATWTSRDSARRWDPGVRRTRCRIGSRRDERRRRAVARPAAEPFVRILERPESLGNGRRGMGIIELVRLRGNLVFSVYKRVGTVDRADGHRTEQFVLSGVGRHRRVQRRLPDPDGN